VVENSSPISDKTVSNALLQWERRMPGGSLANRAEPGAPGSRPPIWTRNTFAQGQLPTRQAASAVQQRAFPWLAPSRSVSTNSFVRVFLVLLFIEAAFATYALAQPPQSAALPRVFRSALLQLFPESPTEVVESLPQPLCLGSGIRNAKELNQQLGVFETVPRTAGSTFEAGPTTLMAQLRRLNQTIEISNPHLSASQEAEVERARNLLYAPGTRDTPTEPYRKYLDYQHRERDLSKKLAGADPTTGGQAVLTQELLDLRRDWSLYGDRAELEHALNTLHQFGTADARALHDSWTLALQGDQVGDYAGILRLVANMDGWTALTVPVGTQVANTATIVLNDHRRPRREIPLRGLAQISFRAAIYKVPRPALAHQFLLSPNWRSMDSFVLSDGLPTDSPSELVPRAVTSLVVVKGVEYRFEGETITADVIQAINAGADVTIGGFPAGGQSIASFTSPSYIATSNPCIVAALVALLPKIPNTSPTDRWPWW